MLIFLAHVIGEKRPAMAVLMVDERNHFKAVFSSIFHSKDFQSKGERRRAQDAKYHWYGRHQYTCNIFFLGRFDHAVDLTPSHDLVTAPLWMCGLIFPFHSSRKNLRRTRHLCVVRRRPHAMTALDSCERHVATRHILTK